MGNSQSAIDDKYYYQILNDDTLSQQEVMARVEFIKKHHKFITLLKLYAKLLEQAEKPEVIAAIRQRLKTELVNNYI